MKLNEIQPRLCRGVAKSAPRAANWKNQWVRADGRYLRVRIEEFLRDHPEGATRAALAKALGTKFANVSTRITEMEREGVIEIIDVERFRSHGQEYKRAVYGWRE
jgi:hypothetical protein